VIEVEPITFAINHPFRVFDTGSRLLQQKIIDLINSSETVVFYCEYAPKWPVRYLTDNFAAFGYDPEALYRQELCYQDLIHPKDLVPLEQEVAAKARDGDSHLAKTIRLRKPDGDYAWVDIRLTFERNAAGDVTHLLGKIVDVTDKVQAEERLKIFAKVIEQTADFVKITDRDGRLVFVNQALLDKTGYTEDELLGKTPGMLKSEMQDQAKAKALWDKILSGQVYQNRIMNRCKDGSTYHEDTTISPIFNADGEIEYFVSTGKDVSEQVKMQQALNEMAMKDVLTGLCNRRHLMGVIEQAMVERQREGKLVGMILFDVDFFKEINDRYGHDVGDEVLLEMADILKNFSAGIDHVGRWGGEEFLLLVLEPELSTMMDAANQLRERIERHPFAKIDRVTVSIGVTLSRLGDSPADLFKRADQALYQAKHNGRNRVEVF
jgi:diguanylate cyclase (GGDEF)-like protein/PAS domain S-box-containing protein